MQKLWIFVATAALVAFAYPASAQLSTASSRKAEQAPTATSGTMHDHVERAENVVKQLLAQHSASPQQGSKNMMAVERTQLERLQTELDEINTSSVDTSAEAATRLDTHVANAKNLAASLANEPSSSSQSDKVVTVDRKTLKELRDQIEAIERLAKHQKS